MEDFITIEEHSTLSNKTKVKSWNKNDGPLRNKTKPLGLSTLGKKAKWKWKIKKGSYQNIMFNFSFIYILKFEFNYIFIDYEKKS